MFSLSKESIDQVWYSMWFGAKQRLKLYKSLATLLRNNVPLRQALVTSYEVYSDNGKKPDRIEAIVLQDCIAGVDNGRALSFILQQWVPFDEHSTIATGDRGGKVADALMRGAEVIKRKGMMRKALISAVTYPAMLMLSVGGAFYLIATKVMPRLLMSVKPENMDSSVHLLSWLSSFVADNGAVVLLLTLAASIGIGLSMPRLTGKTRFFLDKFPPWSMYRIVQGAIFLYNVGVLLEANVPKKEILEMMLERANPYMAERLDGALLGVKNGLDLGQALRASGFEFPSRDAIAYVSVIGSMEGGEAQLKEFGEDWLDESVDRLATASAIFKQIAILAGGLLIMAIVQGVNALSSGMLN
ncbi:MULTISPECIES: type II secretion system F family protein [unclassified Caballeronia]|uniref:type II secretion system F family protein n=1 Tax=unclassified Caballeronia TaxID=2646786 RepID=UPI002863AAD2|nr:MULTISPECIES: type II secretion system F family protein [unclassified Caballeronia]MDR5776950.1 type II secretion system F family protein [Caballeronia sp. LZ002]MDR5852398.1 type II secretion system F family protein [Caballeronia sp. LZ003]